MRFTKSFCVLLSSSVALPAFGQATNAPAPPSKKAVPLTLDETIRLALEHNLVLQIDSLEPAIVEYNLRAAYSYYDPTLTSQASRNNSTRESGGFNIVTGDPFPATRSEVDTLNNSLEGRLPTGMRYTLTANAGNTTVADRFLGRDTNGFPVIARGSDTTDASVAIRVTQPLLRDFWIDAGRLQIKLRKKDLQISELGLRLRTMSLVTTVEQAYYDLVHARESVRVAEADIAVSERLLQENRRKVEVGTLPPLEQQRAQAALARSRLARVNEENRVGSAETVLRGLLTADYALHLEETIQPTDPFTEFPPLLNLQESFNLAMAKNPELEAVRVQLEQQQLQVKYDFNQLFPRLDLFATWGVNGLDPNFGRTIDDLREREFQQDAYGVLLSFPLATINERNRYKASKLEKVRAVLRVKELEERVIRGIDDAVREVRSAYDRILLTRDTVAFAEAEFEAEQKRLDAGVGTSFFVLEAQTRLTRARFERIAALRDYNRALAELSFREATTLDRRKVDLQLE